MKKLGVAIFLLSSYCHAQTSAEFQHASSNVWGAEYPRVDASGRAEFRIKYRSGDIPDCGMHTRIRELRNALVRRK